MCILHPAVHNNQLTSCRSLARHALTRLPEKLRSIQLMEGLFGLLAAVSERKYVLVYPRAEALHQSVQPPNFPSDVLGQVLAGMISAFVGASPLLRTGMPNCSLQCNRCVQKENLCSDCESIHFHSVATCSSLPRSYRRTGGQWYVCLLPSSFVHD